MKQGAAIYGAGGHARVVASVARARHIPLFGFFDDSFRPGATEIIQGAPLRGRFADLEPLIDQVAEAYLAVGDNARRAAAFERLNRIGFSLPPLTHPSALMEGDVSLGPASLVCLGALVGVEARIGQGCILNTGCSVDHECEIGDFVHLAPRVAVAGRTRIGSGAFVGIGAVIADGLAIGREAVIGAGSVVLADVPDGARVTGVHR